MSVLNDVTHGDVHLQTTEGSVEVAIKIFVQGDSVQISSAMELAKNYADMRYELNKLSTMKHPFIVRFVGVLTNPLCFVLEWAPGKSLEHIRKAHSDMSRSICPTTLSLVLLQVNSCDIHYTVSIATCQTCMRPNYFDCCALVLRHSWTLTAIVTQLNEKH